MTYQDECPRCNGEDEFKQADLCPQCIVEYSPGSDSEDGGLDLDGEVTVPTFEEDVFPEFREGGYFAMTVEDGRKLPKAPWLDDSQIPADKPYDSLPYDGTVGYNWDGVPTTLEETLSWTERIDGWFPASSVPDVEAIGTERRVLIDIDNCRNPVTGEIHPVVSRLLEEIDSYAQVSYSGTGVHIYVYGTHPEGFKKTIDAELEDWDHAEAAGGEPNIEVYTRAHYFALTGRHITCTPVEVNNEDEIVEQLFEEFGEKEAEAGERGEYDPEEFEPDLSRDEVSGIETTSDIEVIYDAISHVDYGDFRLRSTQTEGGSSHSERKSFDAAWVTDSESGTRLGHDGHWIYREGNIGLDSLQVVALEEGIIRDETEYPSGEDFQRAVEELRSRGADIPEYEPPSEAGDIDYTETKDHVRLPDLHERAERIGWQIHGGYDGAVDQTYVHEKTEDTIDRVMDRGGRTVVDGIMGSGKTYSSFKVAHERDEPILYCAPRAELYDQGKGYALDVGYAESDVYVMPAMFRECPSACGDHGQAIQDKIRRLHSNGVNPKTIHSLMDLPCEEDGDCPYRAAMQFDPDEYDVIIGHYTHAHLPQVVSGRHVIVDEQPLGAYFETIGGDQLVTSINTFLGFEESPPIDDFKDLLAARDDPGRVEECKDWFEWYAQEEGWEPDERNAFRHELQDYHALTPHAVYGILTGERPEEGSEFYRQTIDGRNPIIFHEADEDRGYYVQVNRAPSDALHYARSVIGLDGTPMTLGPDDDGRDTLGRVPLWDFTLNLSFNHRRVLSDEERREWLRETQNISIIQASDAVKPYSSGEYANKDSDFALIGGAHEQYGLDPTVISTKAVREEYESQEEDVPCPVEGWDHYGNIRGSNEYANHRLGILLGSPHYGDDWIAERAAMLGHTIDPSGKGVDREYGSDIGNALLSSMREATLAQAALRFGRDGRGAIVLIASSAYPDWLPVEGETTSVTTWTETQEEALDLFDDGWAGTTAEFAEAVGVSERQGLNVLQGFADRDYIERSKDPEDGRRYVWTAEDVDGVPTYGETSLPSAILTDDDDLAKDAVSKHIREVSYTGPGSGEHTRVTFRRRASPESAAGDGADVAVTDGGG